MFDPAQTAPQNFMTRNRCLSGSLRWISWATSFHDAFIYASGRDITDEKEFRLRLQKPPKHCCSSRRNCRRSANLRAA